MKKIFVFIISVDIILLFGVVQSCFAEAEIKAYTVICMLCLTFVGYHVVSAYIFWQNSILKKVSRIRFLYRYIYQKEPCGGAMHIVLDDWNVEDEHIYWCLGRLDFLVEKGELDEDMKGKYEEICKLLLSFDEIDRFRILRDCELFFSEEEHNDE